MQIKAMVSYHHTSKQSNEHKNNDTTKHWWGRRKTNHWQMMEGRFTVMQPLWKTARPFHTDLNVQPPYVRQILFLAFIPEKQKLYSHENLYMNGHSSLILNSSKAETTQRPNSRCTIQAAVHSWTGDVTQTGTGRKRGLPVLPRPGWTLGIVLQER